MNIKNWLLSGCVLIYMMLVVGCITRLTHSGLSITQWSLFGSFPPLSDDDWEKMFELYRKSPEYQKVNFNMDIETFKSIYFWEYLHRFIGRFIGLVFLGGFLYFSIRKKFQRKHYIRFGILFLAGLAQGLIGWWMVKSGLVDKPAVSHYRLATHLISAFTLFSLTFLFYLDEKNQTSLPIKLSQENKLKRIKTVFISTVFLFFIQVVYGAFTAGYVEGDNAKIRPGNIFNTWPKMGEEWYPEYAVNRTGNLLRDFTENPAGIQFIHRWLGFLVLAGIIVLSYQTKSFSKDNFIYKWITRMLYAVVLQILLGIYTLIENVPIYMGVLHQSGALLLCLTMMGTAYHLFRKNNYGKIA